MNKHRATVGLMIAAATIGFTTACSSDDNDTSDSSVSSSASTAASSVSSAASSVASRAGDAFDSAKLTAFVVAFRTGYHDLSTDRDDDSIKKIVTDTCALRDKDATDDEQKVAIIALAANGSTTPSDEQASRILDMVVPACP